jgi:hypothetical protein
MRLLRWLLLPLLLLLLPLSFAAGSVGPTIILPPPPSGPLLALLSTAGVLFNFSAPNSYQGATWQAAPNGLAKAGLLTFNNVGEEMDLSQYREKRRREANRGHVEQNHTMSRLITSMQPEWVLLFTLRSHWTDFAFYVLCIYLLVQAIAETTSHIRHRFLRHYGTAGRDECCARCDIVNL